VEDLKIKMDLRSRRHTCDPNNTSSEAVEAERNGKKRAYLLTTDMMVYDLIVEAGKMNNSMECEDAFYFHLSSSSSSSIHLPMHLSDAISSKSVCP
jgi:hypothetical protein